MSLSVSQVVYTGQLGSDSAGWAVSPSRHTMLSSPPTGKFPIGGDGADVAWNLLGGGRKGRVVAVRGGGLL